MKKKEVLRGLIEVAICAAIAFILDLLQTLIFGSVFFAGGSIGIAMLPIFVVAYRRGFLYGILCGLILSCIQIIGEPMYIINGSDYTSNAFLAVVAPFIQVALDYFLAYTLVGFAGLFKKKYDQSATKGSKALYIVLGCVLGGTLKYLCHTLSGGLFWLNLGSTFWNINDDTWLYTFLYNGAYSIPNTIISTALMVVIALFYPVLINANKAIFHHEPNNSNEENKDAE